MSSTFADAIATVATLTRRGADKEVLIKQKINGAIKLISSMGLWPRDLEEFSYLADTLSANSYTQSLELPARTRKVAYIQDATRLISTGNTGEIVLQEYSYILANGQRSDVAYQAGNRLQLRLSTIPTQLNVGVYRYQPLLVQATDTNWILEDMYDIVTDYAATWILTLLGEKELVATITGLAGQQLQVYLQDRINQLYGK